jgi:hypothetical protein
MPFYYEADREGELLLDCEVEAAEVGLIGTAKLLQCRTYGFTLNPVLIGLSLQTLSLCTIYSTELKALDIGAMLSSYLVRLQLH